jgi:hypothetical protein
MTQVSPDSALALAFRTSNIEGAGTRKVEVTTTLKNQLSAATNEIKATEGSDLGRLLFLGPSMQLSATLGRIHPRLRKGQIHPSTSDALRGLIKGLRLGEICSVPQIQVNKLDGSAVILGGPVANLHARLIMGCGGPSPLFGTRLPVTFDCLSGLKEAKLEAEPWKVVVENRTLSRECLVLTSLPMDNGDKLTIAAGLHGAGTRALAWLLKDEKMLEQILKKTNRFVGWQAVVEVAAKDTETPLGIGDASVYEIRNVDFDSSKIPIRSRLFLEETEIETLLGMLPQTIDLSDSSATGMVIPFRGHKSQRTPIAAGSASRPKHHSGDATSMRKTKVQKHDQIAVKQDERVQRGRPAKGQPPSVRLHQFPVNLSEADHQRLGEIVDAIGSISRAEVIRQAIRELHDRVLAEKPSKPRK